MTTTRFWLRYVFVDSRVTDAATRYYTQWWCPGWNLLVGDELRHEAMIGCVSYTDPVPLAHRILATVGSGHRFPWGFILRDIWGLIGWGNRYTPSESDTIVALVVYRDDPKRSWFAVCAKGDQTKMDSINRIPVVRGMSATRLAAEISIHAAAAQLG